MEMKQIQTITRTLPNGGKRILRLYSIRDGIGIRCTVEYANKPFKSTFDGRTFNRTQTFDTLEKNIKRAYRHFKVGAEDDVVAYKTIYVTYTRDGKCYAAEVDNMQQAMDLVQELMLESSVSNIHVNKCGRLPKGVVMLKMERRGK